MTQYRIGMLGVILILAIACQQTDTIDTTQHPFPKDTLSIGLVDSMYQISRKGKLKTAPKLQEIYTFTELDTFGFPIVSHQLLYGLKQQRRILKYRKQRYNYQVGNLQINIDQLDSVITILEKWQHIMPIGIHEELVAHQIKGKDKRGNVKFTGYFTPIIRVNKRKTRRYPYPIYGRPIRWEGPMPSRKEIELGALDSVKQVLAYARSKVDIYYMQLQGSGFAEYPNGERQLFSYHSSNGHPYRSIETFLAKHSKKMDLSDVSMDGVKRFLKRRPELVDSVLNQNPSYPFFQRKGKLPRGSGQVPLTEELSIAVDPRYVPVGSCFLAAVPLVDKRDDVIGHEYKILLAQDVGGAIRGAGHVDFYFGTGAKARKKAKNFNAYGRLWLLLPKEYPDPTALQEAITETALVQYEQRRI
ncbi:MAG: MltA domain-containing protein [Bacteroidota bacterium]